MQQIVDVRCGTVKLTNGILELKKENLMLWILITLTLRW